MKLKRKPILEIGFMKHQGTTNDIMSHDLETM